MTSSAAVGQSGADLVNRIHISRAITDGGTLTLRSAKFTLEELAATANGAKRITTDDELRRIWRHLIPGAHADFLAQRLVNPGLGAAGCLSVVEQLSQGGGNKQYQGSCEATADCQSAQMICSSHIRLRCRHSDVWVATLAHHAESAGMSSFDVC
jgi:hypothetical protein